MKFNFKTMTKEQQQIIALICIFIVGTSVAFYMFVLTPFLNSGKEAVAKHKTYEKKLAEAEMIIAERKRLLITMTNLVAQLQVAEELHIAPMENPLSWVSEKVYRLGRDVGLDIESVAELVAPAVPWQQRKGKGEKSFNIYAVRIDAECGLHDLIKLVYALENSNPYLCITEISVMVKPDKPTKHDVSVTVQWPWGSIKKAVESTASEEADDKKKDE